MVSAAHFITAILCFLLVHGVAEKLRVGIITGPKDIEVPWNTAATFVCVVPCGETVDWYEVGKPTRLRTGQDGLQIHEDSTSCTENGNHTVSTLQINAEVVAERNGKAFQCATDYIVSICTGSACTTQELRIAFVSFMAQLIVLDPIPALPAPTSTQYVQSSTTDCYSTSSVDVTSTSARLSIFSTISTIPSATPSPIKTISMVTSSGTTLLRFSTELSCIILGIVTLTQLL